MKSYYNDEEKKRIIDEYTKLYKQATGNECEYNRVAGGIVLCQDKDRLTYYYSFDQLHKASIRLSEILNHRK